MENEAMWKFEPTEKQMEIVKKRWGMGDKLKLDKNILSKAGANLLPKVKKAIFYELASMDQCAVKCRSEASGNHLSKAILDEVKGYPGKIKDIKDIQRLLRNIYYKVADVVGTNGDEEFVNLEKNLKGTSVVGKIKKAGRAVKKAVTPQKLLDARAELAGEIDEVRRKIDTYFNSRGGEGQTPLDDKMIDYKKQIDALRKKSSIGKRYNLKDDIDVNSFHKVATIDSAIKTLEMTSGAIDDRLILEEKTRDDLKGCIDKNKEILESYFNSPNLSSDDKIRLHTLHKLMGDTPSVPLQPLNLNVGAILNSVIYTDKQKLENCQRIVTYVKNEEQRRKKQKMQG